MVAVSTSELSPDGPDLPPRELCGILNVDKPAGLTSHDVVARVRRATGQRRVGHAGTLDPMATGVLLLCLGQATRVAEYLMQGDKVYRARIRLGITTDTYDAEGQVVAQGLVTATRPLVERVLAEFVGTIEQTPPIYSAIKHRGTPLHRLARRGKAVAPLPRRVRIETLELLDWSPPELLVEVRCGKGTYIRSLAHDLGQRLGCGAHLTGLTRVASGDFRLGDALPLSVLEDAFARGEGERLLKPIDAALRRFPAVTLDGAAEAQVYVGQPIFLADGPGTELCRAYSGDGRLLALLRRREGGVWQPHKVFAQSEGHAGHTRSTSEQPRS